MKIVLVLMVALTSVMQGQGQKLTRETCTADRSQVDIEMTGAQAVIGGLFEIRNPALGGQSCGQPHKDLIQLYEAARWALQTVNQQNIVPGVKIGMRAYDTCFSQANALKAVDSFYPQFSSVNGAGCASSGKLSLGFLGPFSSWTSKPVAAHLSHTGVPVLSPRAMSIELSDKDQYATFMRTTPHSFSQAHAMSSFLRSLQWDQVVVVHTTSDFGRDTYASLQEAAARDGVCIAGAIPVQADGTAAQFQEAVRQVMQYDLKAAVFIGSFSNAEKVLQAVDALFPTNVDVRDIQWVFNDLSLYNKYDSPTVKGAITVLPKANQLDAFKTYFTSLDERNPPAENPWFQDWYMTRHRCKLPGVSYAPYNTYADCPVLTPTQKQSEFAQVPQVEFTVKGIFTYAMALKRAQDALCTVNSVVQPYCSRLQQMTTAEFSMYLKQVTTLPNNMNVAFDLNGDVRDQGFDIFNYQTNGFKQVATYGNGGLVLLDNVVMYERDRTFAKTANTKSTCAGDQCLYCQISRDVPEFLYKPGDLVIGGISDAQENGMEPISCGDPLSSGSSWATAFYYAVTKVKSLFPGILNGVDLGLLAVNTCQDPAIASDFFSKLLGGRELIRDKNSRFVDKETVKGIINQGGTSATKELNSNLKKFMLPMVTITATSVEFNDQEEYPFLTRAYPADDKQVMAMVNTLYRNNWFYIQTVNSPSSYAQNGIHTLRNLAALFGICITSSYEIGKDGSHSDIIASIEAKPDAKVVVFFTESSDTMRILDILKNQSPSQRKFMIVGSDTWGTYTNIIQGFESTNHGSLTFSPEKSTDQDFVSWLSTLNPRQSSHVPGFKEWFQLQGNCYIDAKFKSLFSNECQGTNINNFNPSFDVEMQYTIQSVYAMANALHKTLQDFCGVNYLGVCSNYRASHNASTVLDGYLKETSLPKLKIEKGEGRNNYGLYSYDSATGYRQVGSYSVQTGTLSMTSALTYPTPGTNFSSFCPGNCMECAYLSSTSRAAYIDGDILIGGVFPIHDPAQSSPFSCGNLRMANGIQFMTAMTFAVHQVNKKLAPVSLKGISLGTILMDHCNVLGRTYDIVSGLYSGFSNLALDGDFEVDKIKAWVSSNTVSTAEMNDVISGLNLPLISPYASSQSLSNMEQYPTFFRTIEGDVTMSVAMAKLIKFLDFRYVVVIYSSDDYGTSGIKTFEDVAEDEGICVYSVVKMDATTDALTVMQEVLQDTVHVVITWTTVAHTAKLFQARNFLNATNIVFVNPMPMMEIAKTLGDATYQDFFLNIKTADSSAYQSYVGGLLTEEGFRENPFLAEAYMALNGCNLPGFNIYATMCTSPLQPFTNVTQDNYVIPTINAVYSFTAALDAVLKDKCGTDYNGMCNAFASLSNPMGEVMKKMESVSFVDPISHRFQYVNREGNTGLDLFLVNGASTQVVGDFAGASLMIKDSTLKFRFSGTTSSCDYPCLECVDKSFKFTYKPGDILLGGIFDVHASSLTPFSCGELLTKNGFQLLEAFQFALDMVNDKSGPFKDILRDVKLGGVAMDACQSKIRTGYLVSNVHNGVTKLVKNDVEIDPNDINVYIGSYSSDSSAYLARILKSLRIPQISYGSTSIQLMDQVKYQFFARTVPSDDNQALGMVKFLNQTNIHYVQIIHTRDSYGRLGAQAFIDQAQAQQYKICVAQKVEYITNATITEENANDVVLALLNKPKANTVVVFADRPHIQELLKAVGRNSNARNRFVFLGSETWGTNLDIIAGSEDMAVNSVTFTLDSSDIAEFDTYLSKKSPGNYPENPWFPEFYEEMVDCYLTVPDGKHKEQCASASENIVAQRNYIQDLGVLDVVNAVFAAAIGINKTLQQICGDNFNTVCEQFRSKQDKETILLNNILQAKFTDLTNRQFEFTSKRYGNRGYQLFSLNSKMNFDEIAYTYDKIGEYSNDGVLSLQTSYSPKWDGSCDRDGACTECPKVRNVLPRYWLQPTTVSNPLTVVFFTNIHNYGTDIYRCGDMQFANALMASAFMYTLEMYSASNLRGLVLDICGNNLRVEQDLYSLLSSGALCNAEFPDGAQVNNNTVIGIIPTSSIATVAVNRVVKSLKIPIVSPSATSTLLSNQKNFPYFARTVAPDNHQMTAIVNILLENNWNYFSVVYTSEPYGIAGLDALRTAIKGTGLCVAAAVPMTITATPGQADEVIQTLMNVDGANVVVVIAATGPKVILEAASRANVLQKFLWIGTDTWGKSEAAVSTVDMNLLKGTITVDMKSPNVPSFYNFTRDRLVLPNQGNMPDIWFQEFYQLAYKCQIQNSAKPLTMYSRLCKMTSEDQQFLDLRSYSFILQTIAATHAIAEGVRKFMSETCPGVSFSDCVKVASRWDKLFSDIRGVQYNLRLSNVITADGSYMLQFNSDRFWDLGYQFYTIAEVNGVLGYHPVGSMSGTFTFNTYDSYHGDSFTSACPPDEVCNCEVITVAQPQAQVSNFTITQEAEPRNYFFYKERIEGGQTTKERIYKWPIWAVVLSVLTSVGLFLSVFLTLYFLVAYPIRGGTTILGFMILVGIIAIYATNFAFFVPASDSSCAARRFLMGVVYSIVFAALLVKSIDNWRYSDLEYSVRKYKGLTSACSLFLAALFIVLIEVIIPIEWLILVEPTATLDVNATQYHDWMWCAPIDMYDKGLVLSMIFVMFLVLLTAIFAAMAWDSDSNYYESRWILVSCICTAGCFLVWMIVTTNAGPPFRDPAVVIGNFLNATALLICIPIRKLVLLWYFKNNEEAHKMQQIMDERQDVYSTVYSNQGYDGDMFTPNENKLESETGLGDHNL